MRRCVVGSRDWGRFLERYALPKPAVFMHPGATNDQKADYLEGAQAVENGQVSVWPNGASLTDFAGGSRGTDPFGAFIEHQEKQIVLLATGGTLMSLAESGAGTLAGGAQSEVWQSIVARDSSVIAQAVQRAILDPFLAKAFPGQPVSVRFGFDFTKPPTPKEVFEVAALAKQAGWSIDQQQLEEQTGYTLVKDEPASTGPQGTNALPFMNKTQGPAASAPADATLAAFAKDTGPAADAIRKLLADPSPEAAAALLKDLPSLIPDDPALAAVIADEMAKAFGPVANKTDANGMEHAEAGEGGGQFVGKGEGSSGDPSAKTEKKEKTLDEKVAEVKPERIAEITSGNHKGLISVEEGLAVVQSDPVMTDKSGRKMKFDSTFIGKYRYGIGRTMNEADVDRFRRVQDAIYAVTHDENPLVVFKKKRIQTTEPPRGSQRMYRTPTTNGETWAISWADKVYIRSIQERPKNKPPYEKQDGRSRKRAD